MSLKNDTVSNVIRYESGELSDKETVHFFADLISTGLAWSLQGSYGRTATNLINNGVLSKTGKILQECWK